VGAVGAAVLAEQGGETSHEGVEQGQGLVEVGGGHGSLAGQGQRGPEAKNHRQEGTETQPRCLRRIVALYY
jgi:hypothetical protein